MEPGKQKCRILKQIRKQIADANGILYIIEECPHKGDCLGTCPKCEEEVSYLEAQLQERRRLGKAVSVLGVSAGLASLSVVATSLTSCFRPNGYMERSNADVPPAQTEQFEFHANIEANSTAQSFAPSPDKGQ